MLSLSKRQFLRLAGLAIADRILPRWLWARPAEPVIDKDRKLIIVTFGGGVRYAETFTPDGLRNIPRLAELKQQGLFFQNCFNQGVLSHYNSTASILTGQLAARRRFRFRAALEPDDLRVLPQGHRRRPDGRLGDLHQQELRLDRGERRPRLGRATTAPTWCCPSNCCSKPSKASSSAI